MTNVYCPAMEIQLIGEVLVPIGSFLKAISADSSKNFASIKSEAGAQSQDQDPHVSYIQPRPQAFNRPAFKSKASSD